MGAELPYDVFLSHGAKDKAVVRPLAVAVVIAVFALIASMATAVLERRWSPVIGACRCIPSGVVLGA